MILGRQLSIIVVKPALSCASCLIVWLLLHLLRRNSPPKADIKPIFSIIT